MTKTKPKMVGVKFSSGSRKAKEDTKGEVLRQIRKNCVECAGDSTEEAKYCSAIDCSLWPYRFGKTPGSIRRKEEGKALLDKANFAEGSRFDPEKLVPECR